MFVRTRFTRMFTKILSVILVISMVVPYGLEGMYSINNDRAEFSTELNKGDTIVYASGGSIEGDSGQGFGGQTQLNSGGGAIIERPFDHGFRIGLTRDTDFTYYSNANPMNPRNPRENLWDSLRQAYPEGYLSDINGIYLLSSKVYPYWRQGTDGIAYHVSLANMNYSISAGNNIVCRTSESKPSGKGFMYEQIYNLIKETNGRTKLKSQINTLFNNATAKSRATQCWSYITANIGGSTLKYDIDGRFNAVFHHTAPAWATFENVSDSDALTMSAEMIDVLASCYAMAPNDSLKNMFRAALVDYIDGADLKAKPIGITIEPLFMLQVNDHHRRYVFTMLDLMHIYAGVHSSVALNSESAKPLFAEKAARGDYKAMLKASTDWSLVSYPSTVRASNEVWLGEGYQYSAVKFPCWDYNYQYFHTHSDDGLGFWGKVQNKSNMTNLVVYLAPHLTALNMNEGTGHMWGIMLVPFGNPGGSAETLGKIIAEPDDRVIDSKTLGVPVEVKIHFGTDSTDAKNSWKTIADNAASNGATFEITVKTNRTNSPYGTAKLEDLVLAGVTPEKLKSYVEGEMMGSIFDNVSGYASPDVAGGADPMVVFNYKADFVVKTTYGGKTYEYTGTSTDTASFIVLPERLGYTSEPEAYCELKNYGAGSNMSGTLKEEWEAMAGVPSTEQLYFAAGGSEFIVDIHVEYVENEVAKRTYDSYFTKVNCEFWDGDNSKTHTLGGVTVNTHTGGSYVAARKWDGANPCTPTFSSCCCGAQYVTGHVVDTSPFQAALAEANAYAAEINSTVLVYTDASHGDTRQHAGWNAAPTTQTADGFMGSTGKAGSCCSGHSCPGHTSGDPPKTTTHSTPSCSAGSACAGPHTWHIEVPFTVPDHILCGPCCNHVIPETHDTWAQTWKYDSLKISSVHVWQLDQAAVEGLEEIIGPSVDVHGDQGTLNDGTVQADIRAGRPSIFYNIALKNDAKMTKEDGRGKATGTSKAGRVRYNLAGTWADAAQHDEVTWNLGVRERTCDGLSTTEPNTVSPTISGKEHSEPKGKGFTYHSFKPNPSNVGAVTRFTSATTGVASIGQQNWPVNQVGFLQAHTDATDKATKEYKEFLKKREQSMQAYMITDFLILQTSAGDQSVIYFDQANPAGGKVTAESEIPELNVVVESMWHNNANSAAEWSEDHINVGGYNGKYSTPASKFRWPNQGASANTLFDRFGNPAKTIYRPAKPNRNLMLYNGRLNIILEDVNQHYETGMTDVFWANILHWTDTSSEFYSVNPSAAPYSTTDSIGDYTDVDFSTECGLNNAGNNHATPATDLNAARGFAAQEGFIMDAIYSKEHEKINDIIVHDPVSTENVALISLPDERDQRYGQVLGAEFTTDLDNSLKVCPGEPGSCEFRVLNCTYFKDTVLAQYDFDTRDEFGNPINKVTKNGIVIPNGFSLATKISGTSLYSSSGIRLAIPFTELDIKYTPALRLKASMDVNLTSRATTQMIASLGNLGLYVDTAGKIGFTTGNGDYRQASNITLTTGKNYKIEAIFSFKGPAKCELKVDGVTATFTQTGATPKELSETTIGNTFNIGSMGSSASYGLKGYVDNLTITRMAGSAQHTEDCYTIIVTHPNGLNYHEHTRDCVDDNSYTNTYTTRTTPYEVTLTPGKYIFEVWGGSGGGDNPTSGRGSAAGMGGYARAVYEITQQKKVYVYAGGQGTASSALGTGGGIMGGGHGGPGGYGGGGMSYISTVGTDKFTITAGKKTVNTTIAAGTFTGSSSFNGRTASSWSDPSNKWTTVKEYTANAAGTITFYSTSYTGDPVGRLLVNGSVVMTNDDGGGSLNFRVSGSINKGDKVTVQISSWNTSPGTCNWTCTHPGIIESTTVDVINESVSFNTNGVLILAGGGGGADNITGEALGGTDDGSGGVGGGVIGGNARSTGVIQTTTGQGGGNTSDGGSVAGDEYKVIGNEVWKKVLYQDISNNTNYFTTAEAAAGYYYSASNSGKYLDLIHIEDYRGTDGKFTFMLEYPDCPNLPGQKNIWKQTNNPLNQRTNSGTAGANVAGYEEISYPMYRSGYGKGIEFNGTSSVLDGAVGHTNWWLACGIIGGSYAPSDGQDGPYTMPGPINASGSYGARKCALWVKVPDPYANNVGYSQGRGQSVTAITDTGGGGAGWFGGRVTNYGNGGAGGGSGYVKSNTFTDAIMKSGVNYGNGKVAITRISNIEQIAEKVVNGEYTDQQLTEMFGTALAGEITNAARGSLLHTWSGWTTTKHYGFKAYPSSGTGVTMNGNLVLNIKSNVVEVQVPVSIAANSVRQVRVYFNNGTSSTSAGLFVNGGQLPLYTTIKANTNNQVAVFNVTNHWKDRAIQSLDFDITSGAATGTATVTKIEIYGTGTKTANTGNQITTTQTNAYSQSFPYTGGVQSVTLSAGTYILEVWGAQGGGGSKGGYSIGTLNLTAPTTVYLTVGGQGSGGTGGYNGGGATSTGGDYGGGGASDIRIANNSLYARVIVAGGGGGTGAGIGGYGGGTTAGNGTGASSYGDTGGATQTRGGTGPSNPGSFAYSVGSFGVGGYGFGNRGGGGGGGWYGGSGGVHGGGSGGSGYVYTSSTASNYPSGCLLNSSYYLTSASTFAGNTSFTDYSGSTVTGHSGNGAAKITGKTIVVQSGSPLQINAASNTEAAIQNVINVITNNWQKIPYWLGNREGEWNPVWTCEYLPLNVHHCDWRCHEEEILRCAEPHHQNTHYDGSSTICWDPCNDDAKHKNFKEVINTADGTFTPGNFINLDWGFQVYFPNIGDFDQGEPYGIKSLTSTRGLGFVDDMDTTKWTRVKRIKFPINVIRNGTLYLAGEWITLSDYGEYTGEPGSVYDESNWTNYGTEEFEAVNGDMIDGRRNHIYQFYCVEANSEMSAAEVVVEVEAVNCPGENDNGTYATNRMRYSTYKALHGATNYFYIDVVGRIGNLVLEDTGDYRFSNLFKQTIQDEPADAPTTHSVASGTLETYNSSAIDGLSITSDKAGAGAAVNGLTLSAGQYKITVNGDKLNNGKLNITTQSGWVVTQEFTQESGVVVTEEEIPLEGTQKDTKFTVTGPGAEIEPGKYRFEVYGQGFLNAEWKLRVLNPKNGTYTDYTALCEHYGTTNEKATFIIDLPDGIPITAASGGLELFCESQSNPGFIFDRLVVKKLDTSTLRNIATTDAVQNVTISTSIMSFYVNIASDTPANIIYSATNSGGMTVDDIVVQRLGSYDDSWIVEGIVKKVDETKQNEYFAWGINDIRGVKVSEDTQWLNTYSVANWMNKAPIRLPLAPSKNNIALLQDEPMLVGYDLYMDISTIGNYYENNASLLQVIPYYYVIDLDQAHVDPIPVDGYLKYSKGYYPVNIFGLVTGQNKNVMHASEEYRNMTMKDIYNFAVNLDWINEQTRRNYTDVERYQTEKLSTMLFEFRDGIQRNIFTPLGHDYIQGNSQFLQINGKARTFNGGETTYGELMNLGGTNQINTDAAGRKYNANGRIPDSLWWQKGQRWHFTIGVPSSTVFVRQGVEPNSDTIEEFRAANYIILCCVDIRALGDTWQLRYSHADKGAYGSTHGEVGPGSNGSIQVTTRDGATITYPIPDYLPPALAVYSTVKSSEFDISIVGIH